MSVKSSKAAYICSVLPGLGHYYLGRYLRGLVFTGVFAGLIVFFIFLMNMPEGSYYISYAVIPLLCYFGLIYLSAADVENVCVNISNGKYGNKIQIDGSRDSDSQGGMYCVSFFMICIFSVVVGVAIFPDEGWGTSLDVILFGLVMAVIGLFVLFFVDKKNKKMENY